MFASYNALCEGISDWLAREDLRNQIPSWVWLAEVDAQRSIRFRLREASEEGTTVKDQLYIELPSDYAEGLYLRWTDDNTIPIMRISSFDVVDAYQKNPPYYTTGSRPRVGYVYGDRLYIGPGPGVRAYELLYKAGVQHLGADNPSNVILEQYPDILLYGALLHSAPYLGADERLATWQGFYQRAIDESRKQEERARTGTGALYMRPDTWVR